VPSSLRSGGFEHWQFRVTRVREEKQEQLQRFGILFG
jgi:hypothetical protein